MDEVVSIKDTSILDDIKKYIGPSIAYNVFDMDILMNINAAFFMLYQLGVGPQDKVFTITDNAAKWSQFSEDETVISVVKQYVYLKVRNIFDPPTSSYVLQAYDAQIKELEWRLRELAAGAFDKKENDDAYCERPCPDTDSDNSDGDGDGDDDPGEEPDDPIEPDDPDDEGYVLPIMTNRKEE